MLTKSALAGLIALLFSSTPSARAQPTQQDFPDGPGKETFVSHCGGCHDIDRVRAGYTPEGWRTVIRMMQSVGVRGPKDKWDRVPYYLKKISPGRPGRGPAIIDGPQQI